MKPQKKSAPAPATLADIQDDVMEDPVEPGDQEDSDVPNGDFDFDEDDDDEEDEDVADAEDAASDSGMDDFGGLSGAEEEDGGVSIPTGRALSPSAIPMLNRPAEDSSTVRSTSMVDANTNASLNPQKPTPYTYDPGLMMVTDPNPLPDANQAHLESMLAGNARDAAQSLLNHMLTTCPIHRAPATSTSSSGITMSLPPPVFALPREKKIPQPKAPTRWEQFAARKGIGKHRKGGVGKDGELQSTEGKMVYDEAKGDWVPKWGYKGRNKKGEGDWLVEVDDKKEQQDGKAGDARADNRAARKEKIRRNERAQRANERKTRKGTAAG